LKKNTPDGATVACGPKSQCYCQSLLNRDSCTESAVNVGRVPYRVCVLEIALGFWQRQIEDKLLN